MSEESGYFSSVAGDRKYTARFMNEKLHEAMQRTEGVLAHADGELNVTTDGSLSVDIASGCPLKEGIYYKNPSVLHLTLEAPSIGTKRYDRIAVRVDHYQRRVNIGIIRGTEALSPAVPDYRQDDIPLATVLVDRTEDPPVLTLTDERQMRPQFMTNQNSIDDLKEGTEYCRVLKAKAEAINEGKIGIVFGNFGYISKISASSPLESYFLKSYSAEMMVGRSDAAKSSMSNDSGMTWITPNGITIDSKITAFVSAGIYTLGGGGKPARIFRCEVSESGWYQLFEDRAEEYVNALVGYNTMQVYAVIGAKIYFSGNSGTVGSWVLKGTMAANYGITALECVGNGVLLAAGSATDKIWRSTDSGATWNAIKTTACPNARAGFLQHVGNGVVLLGYGGTNQGYLYRSTDYGLTWDEGIQIDYCGNYHCLYVDGENIYLPVRNSIYLSSDGGALWELKYKNANWDDIRGLSIDPKGVMVTISALGYIYWGNLIEV
jgi:hypothetical protein